MKRRHCGICGLPGHDRRAHAKTNPEFFTDALGVAHPIRKGKGVHTNWGGPYKKSEDNARAGVRKARGLTAFDEQIMRRFDKAADTKARQERRKREAKQARERARRTKEEQVYRLQHQAEALREQIAGEPAAKYENLLRSHGKAVSESGLIRLSDARKYLPKGDRYTNSVVKRGGHSYLRSEYVLDELASNLGYHGSEGLKAAIDKSKRTRAELDKLESEITRLRRAG